MLARTAPIVLCFFILLNSAHGGPPAPALHVGGDVARPADWTIDRVRQDLAADLKPITYTSRGTQHSSTCVSLMSLPKASGVETDMKMDPNADPKAKNPQLRITVIVEGADGYAVVFSLAELLPQIGNRPAWLALDVDGALPADQTMRLIVPSDANPGRWVHAVKNVTLLSAAATQPAS